jgi:hypothetical protein
MSTVMPPPAMMSPTPGATRPHAAPTQVSSPAAAVNRSRGDTLRTANAPSTGGGVVFEEQLVTEVLQRHREAVASKLDLFGEVYLNRAFYAGRQWANWSRATLRVEDLEDPEDGIRHTSNKVRPIALNAMALLASGKPNIEVVPATSECADEQMAVVSQAILEYVDKVAHGDDISRERDEYRVIDGTACVRWSLNPEPVNVRRLPLRNPQTGAMEELAIPEYELQAEVYSVLDVSVYPVNATSFRQIRAVLFTGYMPVEEARLQWPQHAAKMQPEPDLEAAEGTRVRIERLHSTSAMTDAAMGRDGRGMVRVFEYVELPTQDWPEGKKLTVVCRQLVARGPNPYVKLFPAESPNFLKLGCVFYRAITIPGRCWGESIITDLRPLQVRHNKIITDLERNRLMCGSNKFVVTNGADDQLTNAHGAVINVKGGIGGSPVQVIPALPLAGQVFQELQANEKDMDDAGMRPEIARGINAPQVRSAEQTAALQEAANLPFGRISRDTELGAGNEARLKLTLARTFYSADKIMRIVGATKGFAPAVIRNASLYTDVSVVEGSAFPRNRTAWNRMLGELWQLGALVDANGAPDFAWLRRNMDLGGTKFDDRFAADRDNAQTENQQLAAGQWKLPTPVDADIVHLDEHELYLKRNPNLPPQAAQMIFGHMQAHVQKLVQQSLPPPGAPVQVGQEQQGRQGQQRQQGPSGNQPRNQQR